MGVRLLRAEAATEGGALQGRGGASGGSWLALSLGAREDAASGVLVAVPGAVQPPRGPGGGPEPGGASGAKPAIRRAAWAESGVDGNRFQHPAGDRDPHGIVCLQAHSASMTAKQAGSASRFFRVSGISSCVAHGSVEKLESEPYCLKITFGLDS